MISRTVTIAIVFVIALQVFPGESVAFWWLFKNKKEESPAAPPASYAIGIIEYRHDFGDAVRVAGSASEFVICESCPNPTALEREMKPVAVVLKMTEPTSSSGSTPVNRVATQFPVTVTETSKTEGSPPSSASTGTTVAGPAACRTMTVYFDLGSSRVRDEDRSKIEEFSRSLTGKEAVLVKGYTCDIGGKKFNDRLALTRARAVAGIIENAGLSPVMVSGEGKCCYLSDDKVLNRRVEIRCEAVN